MRRIDLKTAHTAHFSTMREINRQIVLNYVREKAPISRAEIARETALQPSTISTIVDALVSDGLIEEIGTGESTGGRRPTLLTLRSEGAVAIGIDIAPTRTTIATSDLAGNILDRVEFETSHDYEKTIGKIIECACDFLRGSERVIEGIGVSLPGLVDPKTGEILYIPYFKWRNKDIAGRIAAATGLSVTIDNDANAAALAELWFGSSEVSSARDFIMVFMAEGVGTGIIFDGQIYRGAAGAAGEFGHMIIGQKAPVACSCGSYDCWEAFASGRAAVKRYSRLKNGSAAGSRMTFAQLVERASMGEEEAKAAISETARYLSIGISNLIVGFSPELVVVGGSITVAWPLVADVLRETVERGVRRGLPSARIIASTLGDQATMMGALSLVLAAKFSSAMTA
ncbi:MAG: ROK family protein [Pyrinomonadaceae bacterium]